MATDFAVFLHRFLTWHLAGLRGCSPNTIASYRDTFKLLIAFFSDVRSIPPGKLTLDRIDAHAVTGFLNWLETERGNSIATRNQRLAAVSSLTRRSRPSRASLSVGSGWSSNKASSRRTVFSLSKPWRTSGLAAAASAA